MAQGFKGSFNSSSNKSSKSGKNAKSGIVKKGGNYLFDFFLVISVSF
jgi:hypothetical protein